MLEYKFTTLEDKEWVEPIFKKCNRRGNEYTFSNLLNWAVPLNIKIAKFKDCIMFKHFSKSSVYSCPIGDEALPEAISVLLEESHKYNDKLKLVNMDEFDVAVLEKDFPGQFDIVEVRDNFDYIYEAESLGKMVGKKYHSKKNHMNKFMRLYPNWRYEEITRENIDAVRKMCAQWYEDSMGVKDDSIALEVKAIDTCFDNYFYLNMYGGIIYVGDEIAAFAMGHYSSDDTMVCHYEKGNLRYEGVYTMIAKEFAYASFKNGYKYINREDDLGIEGLRSSKLSYRPVFFYKRFEATEV